MTPNSFGGVDLVLNLVSDCEGKDHTGKYLLLSNSHDGKSAVQIKFTPIRVVCENTLTMALNQGPTLRVPHTTNVQERLMIAANMLNAIKIRFGELEGVFKRMTRVQMNEPRLQEYLQHIFPEPRQKDVFWHATARPDERYRCQHLALLRSCARKLQRLASSQTGE